MCTRFAIRQNSESVGQADRAKMIDVMIHNWSQTDSTIAWRSETDQIGLTAEFSLRHMMECHLARDKGAGQPASGEDN